MPAAGPVEQGSATLLPVRQTLKSDGDQADCVDMAGDAGTRVPTAIPPGWWQASDGHWYAPEQHPGFVPPPQGLPTFGTFAPTPISDSTRAPAGAQKRSPFLWVGLGLAAVVALVAGVLLTTHGGSGKADARRQSSPTASSPAPTVSGPALLALAHQFGGALTTESQSDQAYVAAFNGANSDITKQDQQIQQDQTTYNSDLYGSGCDPANLSGYESCVQSEEQQASSAESDVAAANAQIQNDYQQYATSANTYGGALSSFIGQVVGMPWPPSMNPSVNEMVMAARQFRSDLAQQAAVTSSTPSATVSAINAQAGTDIGNFDDSISVTKAALLKLAASLPHTSSRGVTQS
jgi:hypothetical protein